MCIYCIRSTFGTLLRMTKYFLLCWVSDRGGGPGMFILHKIIFFSFHVISHFSPTHTYFSFPPFPTHIFHSRPSPPILMGILCLKYTPRVDTLVTPLIQNVYLVRFLLWDNKFFQFNLFPHFFLPTF